MKDKNIRFSVLTGIVLFAVFSRLIPHPVNFTPIMAIALFAGAYFTQKKWAFVIPISAMLISDITLMFTQGLEFFAHMRIAVYTGFILATFIGFYLRGRVNIRNLVIAPLISSILFFVIVNTVDWAGNICAVYDKTWQGYLSCNIGAVSALQNMLLSAWFYSGILFGAFEIAQKRFPVLTKPVAT